MRNRSIDISLRQRLKTINYISSVAADLSPQPPDLQPASSLKGAEPGTRPLRYCDIDSMHMSIWQPIVVKNWRLA